MRLTNFKQASRVASRRVAFTLVELLVVIGIIALLISILIPALNKARFSAQTLSCLSRIRQISFAINMYASENKGALPRFKPSADYNTNPTARWKHDWVTLCLPYLGKFAKGPSNPIEFLQCPVRTLANPSNALGSFPWDSPAQDRYYAHLTYRVNGASTYTPYDATHPGKNQNGDPNVYPFGPTVAQVGGAWIDTEDTVKMGKVAPDTIMVTESVRGGPIEEQSCAEIDQGYPDGGGYIQIRSFATSNHNGKNVSIAFFDGHSELVTASQLYKDLGYFGSNQGNFNSVAGSVYNSNWGSMTDVKIWGNNSNGPTGHWTVARD
jgi:prepilin-type processing-associated H-X9-DG protein